MTKVRMLKTTGRYTKGRVYEVDDLRAETWVRDGFAKEEK